MDGFFRIFKKAVSELICTRLYVYSTSYFGRIMYRNSNFGIYFANGNMKKQILKSRILQQNLRNFYCCLGCPNGTKSRISYHHKPCIAALGIYIGGQPSKAWKLRAESYGTQLFLWNPHSTSVFLTNVKWRFTVMFEYCILTLHLYLLAKHSS